MKEAVLQTLSDTEKDGTPLLPSEISRRLNIDPTIESNTRYYNFVRDTLIILKSEGHADKDDLESSKWRITAQGKSQLDEYRNRELQEIMNVIEDN